MAQGCGGDSDARTERRWKMRDIVQWELVFLQPLQDGDSLMEESDRGSVRMG